MSLMLKSNKELLEELDIRKAKFSSYRIASNKANDLNTLAYSYSNEESLEINEESLEIVDELEPNLTVNVEANKEAEANIEVETNNSEVVNAGKVIDFQKTVNKGANSSGTGTYNQRMKSGYFGRRRARLINIV